LSATASLPPAWTTASEQQGVRAIAAGGVWTLANIAVIERALADVEAAAGERIVLDLSAIRVLDTAGAYLLSRWLKRVAREDRQVEIVAADPAHTALLERVKLAERQSLARPTRSALVVLALRTGRATFEFVDAARNLLSFFGQVMIVLARSLLQPRRLRLIALFAHIERIGLHALPIVGLLSFLIGVVLAYQGADQLRAYGAEIFTVNLLGVSILRELGILLTAIMVAGRTGSAFTAEIGTMRVNEEVDAMLTLGLDPVEILVLPRLLAMMIALPLLTLYADLLSLAGGAAMAMIVLDISLSQFLNQLREAVVVSTFWVGMVKAPVFAFLIALVGCYEGLRVTASAESVGLHTTRSVVESIFLVIVADAAFSILFSFMGI
jgi:phospholipid/cholesterol/gamma-HCH transport system permease protein